MSYGLSFSDSFFWPDLDTVEPSDEPTTVFQAVISLPRSERLEIAQNVLGVESPEFYVDSEEFDFDVMERIRETDTCDDLCSPITVYIDAEGYYSVTVYES